MGVVIFGINGMFLRLRPDAASVQRELQYKPGNASLPLHLDRNPIKVEAKVGYPAPTIRMGRYVTYGMPIAARCPAPHGATKPRSPALHHTTMKLHFTRRPTEASIDLARIVFLLRSV